MLFRSPAAHKAAPPGLYKPAEAWRTGRGFLYFARGILQICEHVHLPLQLSHNLLVRVHPGGDARHVLRQASGAAADARDAGDRPVHRAGYGGGTG